MFSKQNRVWCQSPELPDWLSRGQKPSRASYTTLHRPALPCDYAGLWGPDKACRGAGSPGALVGGCLLFHRLWPCAHLPTPPARGRDAWRGLGCPAHTVTHGPTGDAVRPAPEPVTQVGGARRGRLLSLLWGQGTPALPAPRNGLLA